MPEPVIVQIAPDHITYGFYTLAGNTLTMTDHEGVPVDLNGMTFTHELRPSDKPDSVAAVLTGQIRRLMRGSIVEGFDQPLRYSASGVA